MPSAFVAALRAEQTSAILLFFICDLGVNGLWGWEANPTTSSAIFSANFPTLVPPNFCTIQPLSTSELRCSEAPFTTGTPFGGSLGIVVKDGDVDTVSHEIYTSFLGTGGGPEEFYSLPIPPHNRSDPPESYKRPPPPESPRFRYNFEHQPYVHWDRYSSRPHRLMISS